jgi:hypothetical protein
MMKETPLEQVLTSFCKADMMQHLASYPHDFEEAIHLAISNKQPYSWRAAWLLWSCMEENDRRIRKYIPEIIGFLNSCHDGHQRELIKILYLMEIDEDHEGMLFDFCMGIWEKLNKQPSVRYNALRMIVKIAEKYPDLYREIAFLTESHYLETLSPGVRRGIIKMIEVSSCH